VFQPMKNGNAAGQFIVFADGFAGRIKEPGRAAFSSLRTHARPRRRHLYLGRLARQNLARDLSWWTQCGARLRAGISGSSRVLLGGPSARRCASRRRARGRIHPADATRRNPSGSGAWVPDISRSCQQRDVRRMSRLRRQRQPRRRRPDGGLVAVERWKSRGAHEDDFGGRRYAEKSTWAPCRRWEALLSLPRI